MLKLVHDADASANDIAGRVGLDEICRVAAQDMIAVALAAERRAYLDAHTDVVDGAGRRMVVGNGYANEREVTTGAGMVTVGAPRVDDRRDGESFSSYILPSYMRKSPKVTEVLPVLYLRGLSTGDFEPALTGFFGSGAGLSAKTIQRLTESWQTEHADWSERDLSGTDWAYWWVDGIHFNVRLEEDRLCCLVIVGVRPDGTKELVAVADGYRESTESWADLLRSLRDRGVRGPRLAVGDGALGFWNALSDVFPQVGEQRCWVHKTANVLAALPKRKHGEAKTAIGNIYTAQTRSAALDAVDDFAESFAEWPKAIAKIRDDIDRLLAFYDYPADHWVHLRTTNPIESTFATVRLRQRRTKGAGNRAAALAMAYKLCDAAQHRWRRINSPDLAALVTAGARFIDGKLQERPDTKTDQEGTAAA